MNIQANADDLDSERIRVTPFEQGVSPQ